ncbi:hypothetical protein E1A91_A12G128400v1, partial [Gossypium mustelinum]
SFEKTHETRRGRETRRSHKQWNYYGGNTEKEQSEAIIVGSEEMEFNISHILEKIKRFTQLVSELLESGKSMFKELSNDFEERLIMIHKEQMEKWQEEIKELRLMDASNEEATALLSNARFLLQNPFSES